MKLRSSVVVALLAMLAVTATAQATPGDIIVGDSSDDKVFRLKPGSGDVRLISDDSRFVNPNDSVFGANGKIYVADYDAFGSNGGVFSINPRTRATRVVSKDPLFDQPDGIALAPNGDLYVTDIEGRLLRVELPGGDTSVVSEDALLDDGPVGVVVPPIGDPIIGDLNLAASVDPLTGTATAIADGGDGLVAGDGITRAPDGTLYMASSDEGITAIDPETGDLQKVFDQELAYESYGLALDFKGRVVTTASETVSVVNLRTDTVRTYDDGFDYPEGVEVEPPRCFGRTATIVGTTRKDEITGSRFADVIATLSGADVVNGGAGNDLICGGGGADRIKGGVGADQMNGGGGADNCGGGPGRDRERSC